MPSINSTEIQALKTRLLPQDLQQQVITSAFNAADSIDFATGVYAGSLRLWKAILDPNNHPDERQNVIFSPFARMMLAAVTSERSETQLNNLLPQLDTVARRSKRQALLAQLHDQLSTNLATVKSDREQHPLLGRSDSLFPVKKIADFYNGTSISPEAVAFLNTIVRQLDTSEEIDTYLGTSLLFGIKDALAFKDITDIEFRDAQPTIDKAGKLVDIYLRKYLDAWLDTYLGRTPSADIDLDLLTDNHIIGMLMISLLTDQPIFAPWIYGDIMENRLDLRAKKDQLPFYTKHHAKHTYVCLQDKYGTDPFKRAHEGFNSGKAQLYAENLTQTTLEDNTQPAVEQLVANLPALATAIAKKSIFTLDGDEQLIHHIDISTRNGIINITLIGGDNNPDDALLLQVDMQGRVFGGLANAGEIRLEDAVFARIAPMLVAYFEKNDMFPKPAPPLRRHTPPKPPKPRPSHDQRIAQHKAQEAKGQEQRTEGEASQQEIPTVASIGIPISFVREPKYFRNFSMSHQEALMAWLQKLSYKEAEELATGTTNVFETDTFGVQLEFLIEGDTIQHIQVVAAWEKRPLS